MATARSSAASRAPRAPAGRAAPPRPRAVGARRARGIRWDRVGRVVLLIVFLGVVGLYVGPSISFFHTWRESHQRKATVTELQRENARLKARKAALQDPRTLEREARRLGLVKPGERPYIVGHLPAN